MPPDPARRRTAVDPLAFLVGPVEVKYDGDPSKNRVVDLSRYIDHDKKLVRSITGEVTLDYNIGLCTVDAPKAQGACGFLAKAGPDQPPGPLDPIDQPLCDDPRRLARRPPARHLEANPDPDRDRRQADRVGHQGAPRSRAKAASRQPGLEVVSTGKAPWRIADAEFGLSIKNPGLTRATRLDTAGYPVEDVPITKAKNGVTLTPPTDTMYLLLE